MPPREKDWTNILFLSLSPIVGILGTALYAFRNGVVWWEPVLCLALFMAVGFSIGSGYHRLFSHRTYEAHPVVESVFLFFGSLALQNSALQWSRDHREHHRFVDTEHDPYNIKRGFLWAHILWIFYKEDPSKTFKNSPDLLKNPRVMLQHRINGPLGILAGLGIPTLIGALLGRPLGGLLWGGFLRIVLVHHTTFFVNSLAHMWGSRPYNEDNTGRDNWFLAFFTHGEGYHNFHHRFPSDYRNGIRWWQWDPNKWIIRALGAVGLGRALNATPEHLIEEARLKVALAKAARREPHPELAEAVRERFEAARRSLEEAIQLWNEALRRRRELKAHGRRPPSALLVELKAKMKEYEARIDAARQEWRAALELLAAAPVLARA